MISFNPNRRIKCTALLLALALPTSFVLSATGLAKGEPPVQAPPVGDKPASGDKTPLDKARAPAPQAVTAPPALRSVRLVRTKSEMWPDVIEASGNIMPWQESHIGAEVGGLRLASVQVNVGDAVKKGQVLARLDAATVETDLDAANAQLVEAEATLAQAVATLERGKRLAPSGGVSQQELTLYETQKHTAEARVNAARAQVKRQHLKLEFATVLAPDDGVISSATVSEGAIVQAGSELFRLIRQGRLEWRAEVKGETLLRLSPGQEVTVKSPLGPEVKGRIRQLSPTIDISTRNGLVYVDLPAGTNLKAGLNVTGTISMGARKALIVPSTGVLKHEGATQVFEVDGDGKVNAIDVKTGRVRGEWTEIVAGLDEDSEVVAKGVKLLKEGEMVKPLTAEPEVAKQ